MSREPATGSARITSMVPMNLSPAPAISTLLKWKIHLKFYLECFSHLQYIQDVMRFQKLRHVNSLPILFVVLQKCFLAMIILHHPKAFCRVTTPKPCNFCVSPIEPPTSTSSCNMFEKHCHRDVDSIVVAPSVNVESWPII